MVSRIKLIDLEKEVSSGDVLFITTDEGVTLSLQAVSLVNQPVTIIQHSWPGKGETSVPAIRKLNLSACYSPRMRENLSATSYLDLETGELWGYHVIPCDRPSQLPLHFKTYEILKKRK